MFVLVNHSSGHSMDAVGQPSMGCHDEMMNDDEIAYFTVR